MLVYKKAFAALTHREVVLTCETIGAVRYDGRVARLGGRYNKYKVPALRVIKSEYAHTGRDCPEAAMPWWVFYNASLAPIGKWCYYRTGYSYREKGGLWCFLTREEAESWV